MAGDTIDMTVEHIDDVTCIEFNDLEINIASVDMMQREIKRHVDAETTPKLVLDFHNVQYIPTPALGAEPPGEHAPAHISRATAGGSGIGHAGTPRRAARGSTRSTMPPAQLTAFGARVRYSRSSWTRA